MKLKIQLASLSFIICYLSFSAALTSCSEDAIPTNITPSTEYFKIVEDTIFINDDATEGQFEVKADCKWNLTYNAWEGLHAEPTNGEGNSIVSIKTSTNLALYDRKGELTIQSSNGLTRQIHILQKAGKEKLEITPGEIQFGRSGGSVEISVTSNAQWTVSGGTDWCSADNLAGNNNGKFNVIADVNNTTINRKATFTVTTGNITAILTVSQGIKDLLLDASPERTYFGSRAGDEQRKELSIFCNDVWRAIRSDSWIHIDRESGKSDDLTKSVVSITCENNESDQQRVGTITLKCDTLEKAIQVTQSKFDVNFEVPTTSLSFRYDGNQEKSFSIRSNATWTVRSNANWLTIDPQTASPDDFTETIVKVTCPEANTTGEKREATITVTCRDLTHIINVEQGSAPADKYLDVTPNRLAEIPYTGATTTLTVNSNDTWQVYCETNWCHLNSSNGSTSVTGNGSVSITIDANSGSEPRTTTISFFSKESKAIHLTVTQQGYVEPEQQGKEPGQGDNGTPDLTRRGKD